MARYVEFYGSYDVRRSMKLCEYLQFLLRGVSCKKSQRCFIFKWITQFCFAVHQRTVRWKVLVMEILGSLFIFEKNIITISRESKWQILRFMCLCEYKNTEMATWFWDLTEEQAWRAKEHQQMQEKHQEMHFLTMSKFFLALGILPKVFLQDYQ